MKGIYELPYKIKAIAENPEREWQFRRLDGLKEINQEPDAGWRFHMTDGDACFSLQSGYQTIAKSRYQVGETMYVKEAWATTERQFNRLKPTEIPPTAKIFCGSDCCFAIGKKRSPLFMPAWAARHFLQITAVRPERLQNINRADIREEGVVLPPSPRFSPGKFSELHQEYAGFWDSRNPKFPWAINPWVFVYSFKQVPRPEGL